MEMATSDTEAQEVRRTPANTARRSARNSRVHFDGLVPADPDAETHPILIQDISDDHKTVGVYLGFLQVDHKYDVIFKVPVELLHGFLNTKLDGLRVKTPADKCFVQRMKPIDGGKGLEIGVELEIREGTHFEDKFTIQMEHERDNFIHVKISAQILGKGMGTPLLKQGITCTGVPRDDDNGSDVGVAVGIGGDVDEDGDTPPR